MKTCNSIIYHEAGHALVGKLVGARIAFADMTGLTVGCPVVGLDFEPVPVPERPRARALASLAGPIAEAMHNGGTYNWRQDGKVAEVAAKALVQDNQELIAVQLMRWGAEARKLLREYEPTLATLATSFLARQFLTGEEVEGWLRVRSIGMPRVNATA